ncbi:hypothetical protein [Microbacterium sp. NIBRBAC000506063]|uniref:hypothetical protein n=1 Tax=Microbacterium sp. NIBRBAC000506063 TaxID=2734618 RepID=UPI001BB4997D|nr:hypothetical protein [Microbacterium sp. NIBRBAC000506063]QTV80755.1 hypothetical protein KAE78_14950 [Microbacterium sp. NIBRBAC000506063]
MTTSDQQGSRPLTRKQLRELRLTGSTPVVAQPDAEETADESAEAPVHEPAEAFAPASARTATPSAPTPADAPRTAVPESDDPVVLPEERETPDAASDAADAPERTLTRREIRELERQRAAAPGTASAVTPPETISPAPETGRGTTDEPSEEDEQTAPESDRGRLSFLERRRAAAEAKREARAAEAARAEEPAEPAAEIPEEPVEDQEQALGAAKQSEGPADVVAVSPLLGKDVPEEISDGPALSPSFDELVAPADTTGSQHISPTALIFSQTPGPLTLPGPLDSSGEVVVTGSYEFPSSVGSHGHAPAPPTAKTSMPPWSTASWRRHRRRRRWRRAPRSARSSPPARSCASPHPRRGASC